MENILRRWCYRRGAALIARRTSARWLLSGLHRFFTHAFSEDNCRVPGSVLLYGARRTSGRMLWRGTYRASGSVLIMTLLAAVTLMLLGCIFLGSVERDNRFAGQQERSERAWFLAQSGLEYYRLYGCGAQTLSTTSAAIDPPKQLARYYVPADERSQYFEFADMGQGCLLIRGVVLGTLTSEHKSAVAVYRSLVVPNQKVGDAYDPSSLLSQK